MTLSDSVIVMNDGRIMQKSPPNEIYNRPRNTFVARFMGSPSINFFDGRLEGATIRSPSFHEPIPIADSLADRIETETADGDVRVGIRPDNLDVTDDEAEALLSGPVNVFEQMGDETILHVPLEATDREIRVVVPPTLIPDDGERFGFTFDHKDIHLFDAESGEAIANSLERP